MNPQSDTHTRAQRLSFGIVVGAVLLGVVVVALDWRQAVDILRHARWEWVTVALGLTALSYICLSTEFAAASRIFDITLHTRDLLVIGFITIALNNLVSAGGAAGYSVRLILMRRRGQTTSDILAATLLYSYLNMLAVLVLLPLGLSHLLLSHLLSRRAEIGLGIALALTCLTLAAVSAFVFHEPARKALLGVVTSLGRRVVRRDLRSSFNGLNLALTRGSSTLRHHPFRLVQLLGLVTVDWTSCVLAIGCCFEALGSSLSIGVLVTGFAIGVVAGLISMVPGGLGVQDGSMTGIYVLLGVPLEQAVLASVLFRVVYYMIPFVVSLVFYRAVLHESK